jgi:general secretion pathway protein G
MWTARWAGLKKTRTMPIDSVKSKGETKMRTRKQSGFTLVEILIVVVILGILAAIVIPQFSQASTDAKVNSLKGDLQTLRSQIALFKIQHNDVPPVPGTFAAQMTGKTLVSGTVDAAGTFGPYLQAVPVNPFTNLASVGSATTNSWNYTVTGTDATIYAGADTTTDSAAHQLY